MGFRYLLYAPTSAPAWFPYREAHGYSAKTKCTQLNQISQHLRHNACCTTYASMTWAHVSPSCNFRLDCRRQQTCVQMTTHTRATWVPCAAACNAHAPTLSRNTHLRSGARSSMIRPCKRASRYVYMLPYAAILAASSTHQTHIHADPQHLFLHKRKAMQAARNPSNQFLRTPKPRLTNICVDAPTHTYGLLEHITLREAPYSYVVSHARTAPWRAA